jgi:sialic acid synthase SpsE
MTANLFDDLFVLEMANNHLGSVDRGLAIIDAYAKVVRFNGVKAALKLQVRSDDFVHPFYTDMDNRYIKKTLATTLSDQDYMTLVRAIRQARCIPMATPFDECAVETCAKVLDIPLRLLPFGAVRPSFLPEEVLLKILMMLWLTLKKEIFRWR